MTDMRYRLPNEIATQLQVSPSTLRRWSNEFSDYLSDAAGRPQAPAGGQTAHRRYTDEDLETLLSIKGLLAEGLTYIQVGRRLEALRLRQSAADDAVEGEIPQVTALGPSLVDTSPIAPAVTVLADTLHTVADGQQLLLGSQQANRDLLTVVLQDNFGLKEENANLRDRMLELELNWPSYGGWMPRAARHWRPACENWRSEANSHARRPHARRALSVLVAWDSSLVPELFASAK